MTARTILRRWVPLLLAMVPCTAGASGPQGPEPKPLTVFVSIPPQKYVVERVGGEAVEVKVLVPPGQSPETFEPAPRQMADIGQARIFFRVGLPLEEPLFRRMAETLKNVDVVDTRQGVVLLTCGQEACAGHADPHVWLDPERVRIQAGTVCEALCRADPAHQDGYRSRLQGLLRDLERTHRRISALLEPVKGRKVYVFHPAFGYFTDAYGLIQVSLEEEGKEPGPRQMARLIEQARRDRVRVLFVQPQHASRQAQAFADEIGARIVPLDPLAEDTLENMERMAAQIRASFETNP